MTPTDDWDARVAGLWAQLDSVPEEEFVAQIEALAAEKPGGDAAALFKRACAQDSTGHSDRAVPLYRAALAAGLSGLRRRAVIQLASSLRNVGQVQESLSLLTAERNQPSDELDDALTAFLALVLADLGREREALAATLAALAPHLQRYQRSMGNYARALVQQDESPGMTTGLSPDADAALRSHVRALLTQAQAHEMLDDALKDFPTARAGERIHGLPYSASEILWHLRFTQRDILNFVRDDAYAHVTWPDGYWPHDPAGSAREWDAQVAAFRADMDALLALLDDPATDLLAVVPHGVGAGGQTWLREFLLVADHNAYHVAQLALVRRLLT